MDSCPQNEARRFNLAGSAAVALVAGLLTARPALAGPPYITDDPEPTRIGGWENYLYISGTDTLGATAGQVGMELNYGAARNLQLTLTLPEDYVSLHGLNGGVGDLEIAAKYRFLYPDDDSWLPDAAMFPAVTVPTGRRSFSTGQASLFIPVWLEKDFGKWCMFGGGGYDVNPGVGQRNYTLAGLALTRSFGEYLTIGFEIYHQTPSIAGSGALTNVGVGAVYQMTKHWALMASGGPGVERPSRSGTSAFYISLQFTD